jgi:hypothetical protein
VIVELLWRNQSGAAMTSLLSTIANLRRPCLLMRAARHGVLDYERSRDLKRIMRRDDVPSPREALSAVLQLEERAEDARLNADLGYSVARHIDLLVALIGEAALLRRQATA